MNILSKSAIALSLALTVSACANTSEPKMQLLASSEDSAVQTQDARWYWGPCGDFSGRIEQQNSGNCFRPMEN